MATVPVFVCPNCGSEDCILEFIEKAGHKIPGLWHCDKCSWEGKMRECIWTEVIPGVPTHVPVREAPAVVPIRISITSLGTATPEPETPSSQSTCPVACPHCGEKLVEIWVRHTCTATWTLKDDGWQWVTVDEERHYTCPVCGEELDHDYLGDAFELYDEI